MSFLIIMFFYVFPHHALKNFAYNTCEAYWSIVLAFIFVTLHLKMGVTFADFHDMFSCTTRPRIACIFVWVQQRPLLIFCYSRPIGDKPYIIGLPALVGSGEQTALPEHAFKTASLKHITQHD